MGYLCDFCGEQRSTVYCRSDAASLCLSCDCNVHSANALSRRHPRTLVCERCNSQPAFVRCVEEKISLCQNCDWLAHVGSNISPSHKREAINCYSGCPSASELSAIWPFLLDVPSSVGDSTCEQGMSSMSITDNTMDHQGPQEKDNIQDKSVLRDSGDQYNMDVNKSSVWMESPTRFLESRLHNVDQMDGSTQSTTPKIFVSGSKEHVAREVDGFYDNLNTEELDLGIENYDELFCDNPENLFGNGVIFGMKDMSALDCQVYAAEGSSIVEANVMQPACSNVSADSVISCKTEPNFCFARQTYSSLSFSGVTGESSAGDYQDCGVSSIQITGDPPWYPPGPESSWPSTSRNDAVMRYKEKKKARKFEKKVRYESRKARADVRRRVKGRFVKAGEAYDYDPLTPTKSY